MHSMTVGSSIVARDALGVSADVAELTLTFIGIGFTDIGFFHLFFLVCTVFKACLLAMKLPHGCPNSFDSTEAAVVAGP